MPNPLHARRLFVGLSRLMAPAIRHGAIRSSRFGGQLCVLQTRGRRSGKVREASLDYAEAPSGGIWVAAGWARSTAWYLNLLSEPCVSVTLEGRRRDGIATTVTDPVERLHAIRAILAASGFVARLYGIDPRTVSDERLGADFEATPIVLVTFGPPVPTTP
ncbi:MAG: nitroreductase family deazaflavin-dependent oxidoreductase [Chloroflexi bacterium]|nr:nitroreductase family deazaflavin-dependent oxidoreductase [Chloroflexota bacterium]